MFNIAKYITSGLQNTLLIKNNSGFSYGGPWKGITDNTLVDRWHVGDFVSAEYTISAEYDTDNREILKCLVVASASRAKLNVYSRLSTNTELVEIRAVVNDSYIDIFASPKSTKLQGSKLIFTAKYFTSQN